MGRDKLVGRDDEGGVVQGVQAPTGEHQEFINHPLIPNLKKSPVSINVILGGAMLRLNLY